MYLLFAKKGDVIYLNKYIMSHIHTRSGQIDFVVNIYVVYDNKVLLRLHEKHHKWLTPGGHVELNETPEVAAVREVQEEVGLAVTLWSGNKAPLTGALPMEKYQELIPPYYMNIHKINDEHRHITLGYFAKAEISVIKEPKTHEKSGGCRWLTKDEVSAAADIDEATKIYCLKALELLGDHS